MSAQQKILLSQMFCLALLSQTTWGIRFNWKKVICSNENENVIAFDYCYVKAVKANVASMNVHVFVKQKITKFYVDLDLYKRANGWKPFLYHFSIEGCRFLGSRKRNPLVEFFYRFVGFPTHSNLNHSCPYEHDIYFTEHVFDPNMTRILPFPEGDYAINITWSVTIKERIYLTVYFETKE